LEKLEEREGLYRSGEVCWFEGEGLGVLSSGPRLFSSVTILSIVLMESRGGGRGRARIFCVCMDGDTVVVDVVEWDGAV
jgi:hypothetical protein